MTKIAIDGNEANVKNRVGSNVYAFELLKQLEKQTRSASQIRVTVLLAGPAVADLPAARAGWRYQQVGPAPLWTQFALPIHLFLHKADYDVLFTPGHYAPRFSAVPYVSAVMDLAFLTFPDQFRPKDLVQLRDWTRYSVQRAAKIITISQFSRQSVIDTYQRSPADVIVAYPAVEPEVKPILTSRAQATLRRLKIKSPYILYVGTLQPRKNIIRLIEAFEKLCRQPENSVAKLQLVLAGKTGWLADDILARIDSSPFHNQIRLTGYLDEQTKQILYQSAQCSVLIGLYEGFGIPVLESLKFGTIPVVSNSSSLPEVVGKAGILVDPLKVESIAAGLNQALSLSGRQRLQFVRAGWRQVRKFSWEQSAKTVLETLVAIATRQQ